MSISGALHNAYSGLVAASRGAEIVSQNVANAQTEGFGRRELNLSPVSLNGRGGGVRIVGIRRNVDQVAITDRRLSEASLGRDGVLAKAYAKMEQTIGIPGADGSLSNRITAFQSALTQATSRPDSEVRLQNVIYAAGDLTDLIGTIAQTSQDMRMAADKSIGVLVESLKSSLSGIAELNRDIRIQIGSGRDVNGLMDQRQVLVDKLAEIVPVKTYQRDFGQLAISTAGGAVLLDGRPATFGFSTAGMITADMTLASGALSGLTMNGKPVPFRVGGGVLEGGSLAAQFEVRDVVAPFSGSQADALARNLIERFSDPTVDTTLAPTAPGLFTDAGSALDISLEAGLAGRIALNALADPNSGGALWKLRDGLGVLTPGMTGDNTLLNRMSDALSQKSLPATGRFSAGLSDLAMLADDLTARNSGSRLDAEQAEQFSQARFRELKLIESENGVDTDQEMQKLLLVEQAYAANARVISTVDAMFKKLMEI